MRQPPLPPQDLPLSAPDGGVAGAEQRSEAGDGLRRNPFAGPDVVVPGQAGARVDRGGHSVGEAPRQVALLPRVVVAAQLVSEPAEDVARDGHDGGHEHVLDPEVDDLLDSVVVEADLGHLLDQPEVAVVLLLARPLGCVGVLEIGAFVRLEIAWCHPRIRPVESRRVVHPGLPAVMDLEQPDATGIPGGSQPAVPPDPSVEGVAEEPLGIVLHLASDLAGRVDEKAQRDRVDWRLADSTAEDAVRRRSERAPSTHVREVAGSV